MFARPILGRKDLKNIGFKRHHIFSLPGRPHFSRRLCLYFLLAFSSPRVSYSPVMEWRTFSTRGARIGSNRAAVVCNCSHSRSTWSTAYSVIYYASGQEMAASSLFILLPSSSVRQTWYDLHIWASRLQSSLFGIRALCLSSCIDVQSTLVYICGLWGSYINVVKISVTRSWFEVTGRTCD